VFPQEEDMPLDLPAQILEKIRAHAYRHIAERQQTNTNLALVNRVYKAGDHIGPKHQQIYVDRPTAVVFADDEPLANFGHPCRYLFYDPESGEFVTEVAARFPPNVRNTNDNVTPFFSPVTFNEPVPYRYWPPIYFCPRIIPEGTRYAILYAGLTQGRHLNDMEFAYRTLINVYGFKPANIYVLNYDGTRKVWDMALGNWPGNNTPYTIQVTGRGTRAGFQAVFSELAGKMKAEDLLFIHTNNHGDYDSNVDESFLCAWVNDQTNPPPNSDGDFTYYYANEFASDLSVLPAYRALVVMMEQCNSGGFNAPILASSTAAATSVSSAATAAVSSYASADGNWDVFAYEWMAAMNGSYPDGSSLTSKPDTNHDGVVDTLEAYNYAVANDSYDTPQLDASTGGAALSLDQYYAFAWLWCWILWPIFEPIYRETLPVITYPPQPNPPDPGPYYAFVNRVLPEVQQLLLPAVQDQLNGIRAELGKRVGAVLDRARD
jgi:hypothetical protein